MNEELLKDAQLGIEAQAFFNSPIGRMLQERAEIEITEALKLLATVDPEDTKRITKLQNQFYRAESFMGWISEAINTGLYAETEILNDEE